jgi:hypothetical protein
MASEAEQFRVTDARVRRLHAELISGVEQYDITSELGRSAIGAWVLPSQAKGACVDVIAKTFWRLLPRRVAQKQTGNKQPKDPASRG